MKKACLALLAAAIALAGCNGAGFPGGGLATGPDAAASDPFTAGGKDILPRAAFGLLNDKAADVFLLDVRSHAEHQEAHIAGDVLIPRHVLAANIANNTIYPEINRGRTPRKDQAIIVYCDVGNRSAVAADTLRGMSYTRVRQLAGGIEAWQKADLPVVRKSP